MTYSIDERAINATTEFHYWAVWSPWVAFTEEDREGSMNQSSELVAAAKLN